MSLSQAELLKEQDRLDRIRQFDEKTIGRFIDEFVRHFRKYLHGKVSSPKARALDLAHQVVVVLHGKEELTLNCRLMTYAISIGKNLYHNEQSKEFNHPTLILPPEYFNHLESEDDIFEQLAESEVELMVSRCLRRLSQKCREILGKYMNGTPGSDASAEMGYSSYDSYRVRKSECLARMRAEVMKEEKLARMI
jgi:DNA-directed RNA polymerase specialized sigma24 family protein